ncbi:hypothetical protein DIPPA_05351 [Diplonema papillatum]|nr:hypothetical protein DIPPA_05351 [Diplonema papillatum]
MAFTLSHDSVRLAAGAPQTLPVTNGSSDAASFKIRLTHPANTTAKPAKGDLRELYPEKIQRTFFVQRTFFLRPSEIVS